VQMTGLRAGGTGQDSAPSQMRHYDSPGRVRNREFVINIHKAPSIKPSCDPIPTPFHSVCRSSSFFVPGFLCTITVTPIPRGTFTPISVFPRFFCFHVRSACGTDRLTDARTGNTRNAAYLDGRRITTCILSAWFYTVIVVSKTESARLSWFRLLMSYSQETTMHGVRYITEPNSFPCRRLLYSFVTIDVEFLITARTFKNITGNSFIPICTKFHVIVRLVI